jgi:hypothetical protein
MTLECNSVIIAIKESLVSFLGNLPQRTLCLSNVIEWVIHRMGFAEVRQRHCDARK